MLKIFENFKGRSPLRYAKDRTAELQEANRVLKDLLLRWTLTESQDPELIRYGHDITGEIDSLITGYKKHIQDLQGI